MRRKKGSEDAPATGDARITPEEVQQVEFRLAFRGYNERDVDAFLDRITEGLSSYREELEAARSGSGLPLAAAAVSTGDADAIVARARAEADEIVRRAQEQAAGIRAAGAGSGDARGAVAPFLNKEREFLQSLGGLVQTHAEEIKQMVMAIRERAEASASSEAPPRPAAPVSSVPEARSEAEPERTGERGTAASAAAMPAVQPADLEPASAAEIRERLQASEPPVEIGSPEDEDLAPEASPPIVVESGTEPVFSTEGAPASERRERSLRELFWGED